MQLARPYPAGCIMSLQSRQFTSTSVHKSHVHKAAYYCTFQCMQAACREQMWRKRCLDSHIKIMFANSGLKKRQPDQLNIALVMLSYNIPGLRQSASGVKDFPLTKSSIDIHTILILFQDTLSRTNRLRLLPTLHARQ